MAKYSGKEREQAIEPITAERGETETSFPKTGPVATAVIPSGQARNPQK